MMKHTCYYGIGDLDLPIPFFIQSYSISRVFHALLITFDYSIFYSTFSYFKTKLYKSYKSHYRLIIKNFVLIRITKNYNNYIFDYTNYKL